MPMRAPILIEHEGRTTTLKALVQATGINYFTLYERHKRGLTGAALTATVSPGRAARERAKREAK